MAEALAQPHLSYPLSLESPNQDFPIIAPWTLGTRSFYAVGASPCVARCLVVSLASTHLVPVATFLPVGQSGMSVDIARVHWRQRHPQMRTSVLNGQNSSPSRNRGHRSTAPLYSVLQAEVPRWTYSLIVNAGEQYGCPSWSVQMLKPSKDISQEDCWPYKNHWVLCTFGPN